MRFNPVAITLIASFAVISLQPVNAKGTAKTSTSKAKAASDVVVTKNPDGTVEVSDADNGSAPAAAGGGGGGITYKAAPPATIKYGDGVVVRRNADGSVDVCDEDSAHPVYHSFGSAPVARRHATKNGGSHRAAAHKKSK